jgi:hypothetical protein
MPDGVVYVTLIVGFGFVVVAGARIGAGSHHSLAGLFPASGAREWPRGVQEADAPHFDVTHLDGLRPDHPVTVDVATTDDGFDAPPTELIDTGSKRLGGGA